MKRHGAILEVSRIRRSVKNISNRSKFYYCRKIRMKILRNRPLIWPSLKWLLNLIKCFELTNSVTQNEEKVLTVFLINLLLM